MIEFVGRVAVLDPIGADRQEVEGLLAERGFQSPSALLVTLLAKGAGGIFPFMLRFGPASKRAFSDIVTLAELIELGSGLRADLVVVAIGGGGDMLMVAPSGEVFAELVDQSGAASRSLKLVADSIDELILFLVPAEGVLDDMVEYAHNDGFPNRPAEIAQLRLRCSEDSERDDHAD